MNITDPYETRLHETCLISKIAARNDDDEARRLFLMYRAELFRFGVHVLHDQGLAGEMVQETFIKLSQQAGSYDTSRGPVRDWLFTIARSTAYDIARRPSSRPLLPEGFQLPPPDSASGLDSAREQGRVRRVASPAAGLLGAGTRLLPAADRARYGEEYLGELCELAQSGAGRIKQLRYALHQFLRALPMSFVLRYPRRKSAAS